MTGRSWVLQCYSVTSWFSLERRSLVNQLSGFYYAELCELKVYVALDTVNLVFCLIGISFSCSDPCSKEELILMVLPFMGVHACTHSIKIDDTFAKNGSRLETSCD